MRDEYDVDLFCGWFMQNWNEGVSISAVTLSALGARRIALDIDICDGSDTE
ncbi:hypothetical protein AADG42_10165 [Ammonicoccus fulvus]|uniref:Uncharacterized protein n=1 Tax=Ammonicoccus fulvus TaxID=3138240 RepID=A0ABZ3FSF4_9ACTN